MTWRIVTIGKPKLAYAAEGMAEYLKRIAPFAKIEVLPVKPVRGETESQALLARSEGCLRIALDERGQEFASRAFAAKVREWEQRSVKTAALLIGGSDGHSPELRQVADLIWALGKLTLQHELALLVVLEQVYRAYSINHNLPYHRD
jgi:23S rRNA (pseudouridine1915-N3)-methyltransferase